MKRGRGAGRTPKMRAALALTSSLLVLTTFLGAGTPVPRGPDDLIGLCLWYKADAITGLEDGDVVTQWNDSGPRKIHLDKQSGKPLFVASAINRLPAVRFKEGKAPGKGMFNQRLIAHELRGDPKTPPPDGLQASKAVELLAGDPSFTVFLVASIARSQEESAEGVHPLGWGHGGWGVGKVEAGGGLFLELKEERVDLGAGNRKEVTTPDGSYAPHFGKPTIIMCAKAAGPLNGTTQITLNGKPAAVTGSDIVPNVVATPLNVGGYRERALVFLKRHYLSPAMDVAEIIIYSRVLSPEEQNRVGYYLQEKYGIAAHFGAVAASHPLDLTVGVEPAELAARVGFTGRGREAQGAVVELVAPEKVVVRDGKSPRAFLFDGWRGGVTEPSSRKTTVRMDRSRTITAVYKEGGAVFYVALDGRDGGGWSGTLPKPNEAGTDGPFATVARARDAVRELKAKAGGRVPFPVKVLLRGGKYFLDEPLVLGAEDGGNQDFPVTYGGYPGEQPILSGGRRVSGWQPYRDEILQASIDGVDGGALKFRQLFYNGKAQIRARTPNFDPQNPYRGGWATMEGPAEPGSQTAFIYKPGTFPRRWAKPEEAEVNVFMGYGWANNIIPIQSLDEKTRVVTLVHSTKRFMKPLIPYDFPSPFNPNQRFRVENVLEELDQPGEWCWDSGESKLYFWPPDAGIGRSEVTIPVLHGLVELRGASHVTISGLTFTETGSGDNFHHQGMEGVGAMFPMPEWKYCGEALLLDATEHCRVEDNCFVNIGGNAIYIKGPSARNVILGNEIAQIGACGVCLVGIAEKEQYPVFNEVIHNRIHRTGRLDMYSAGVFLGLSEGNVIGHNSIRHVPHHAINLGSGGWSRNILEFNEIRDACLETKDAGAINCWMEERSRDVPRQGHIIRYNLIADSRERGIYLDNYTANCSVYGNIIVRSGFWGIVVNTGKNNAIENNIFVETKGALGVGNWMDGLMPAMNGFTSGNRFCRNIVVGAEEGVVVGEFHGEVANVTVSGFSTPHELDAKTPRALAQSDYNLVFDTPNAESYLEDRRRAGSEVFSVIADPMFVNRDKDDFRLRPESPAFELGFQAIDFSRIGPQLDYDCKSWSPSRRSPRRKF